MYILDRYLLRLFAKVLVITFFSMAGLFIVIDAFGNLDEFLSYGESQGNVLVVLADYYGPRVLQFFDRTSGLLAFISALVALAILQRSNEMTAIVAAGIPYRRIARPLTMAVVVVAFLAVANRELLLPETRDKLARNAQDYLGDSERQLTPRYDYRTGISLGGQATVAAEQRIIQPVFRLPAALRSFGKQISAESALYQPADDQHPAGYRFSGVKAPANLRELPSVALAGTWVLLSPHDMPWLEPHECFVVTDVDFQHLTAGRIWRQYASSWELVRALRNPSLEYGADARVTLHARFVQPALDVTLFLLGLPLILARPTRNIFVVAGLCILVVCGYFLVIMTCHTLGNSGYLLSPSLAAWCPMLVFVPLTYALAFQLR